MQLTFSEIRQYDAENFQVARHLRAAIMNLLQNPLGSRLAALREELERFDRTLERYHTFPEEHDLPEGNLFFILILAAANETVAAAITIQPASLG